MQPLSSNLFLVTRIVTKRSLCRTFRRTPRQDCSACRYISKSARVRNERQAADHPNFESIVDKAPTLIRSGKRHGPGLIILGNVSYGLKMH